MQSVTLKIPGIPMPKGSVTRMRNGAYLPAGTAASRMQFELWKENIASVARVKMNGQQPWPGPVRLMADFCLPVPMSVVRINQWGWLPHIKRPDIDKLTRALLDPMKDIVWRDDSQVCFCTVNKHYGWDESGAEVIIDFLTNDWCQTYAASRQKFRAAIRTLDDDE